MKVQQIQSNGGPASKLLNSPHRPPAPAKCS